MVIHPNDPEILEALSKVELMRKCFNIVNYLMNIKGLYNHNHNSRSFLWFDVLPLKDLTVTKTRFLREDIPVVESSLATSKLRQLDAWQKPFHPLHLLSMYIEVIILKY